MAAGAAVPRRSRSCWTRRPAVAGCRGRAGGRGCALGGQRVAGFPDLPDARRVPRRGDRGGDVPWRRGAVAAHVADWLAQVRGAAGVEEIRLGPLSRAELAGQVAGLAGGPVPPRVVDELYARAEGNPFFTEQLVAATLADASEGGLLQAPAGLPARLAELLAARAGRCAGDARAVLAGLAVAGRPLAEEPLAAVTGLDAEAVRGGLRELAAARLLAEDTSGGEYRPRHALLAEAVAAGLLPGERAALHGSMARALAAAGDDRGRGGGRALAGRRESGRRTARPDRGRRGRRAGIRLRRSRGALATGHRAGPGTARRGRRSARRAPATRAARWARAARWRRRRGRHRVRGDRRAADVCPGHRHARLVWRRSARREGRRGGLPAVRRSLRPGDRRGRLPPRRALAGDRRARRRAGPDRGGAAAVRAGSAVSRSGRGVARLRRHVLVVRRGMVRWHPPRAEPGAEGRRSDRRHGSDSPRAGQDRRE